METREDARRARVRRVLGAVLLPLLAISGCAAPPKHRAPAVAWDQTRLNAMLQLADEQIAAGKFAQARDTLAMYRDCDDARLVCALARVDVEEGNYEPVLRRLDAIAPAARTTAACQRLRGIALEGLGRWPEAATAYEAAYGSEPKVDLLMAWLETLILAGQPDAAARVLAHERDRYPGQPALQVLAADLYVRDGKLDEAIRELTTAGLAEPHSPTIRRRLAEAYSAAGRFGDASVLWRGLLGDCQDEHERYLLRSRLAACLTAVGAPNEARELYRVLVLAKPDDAAVGTGLAAVNLLVGQPVEALEVALDVVRQHPENTDARLLAALSYRHLNQPEKADALLSGIRGSGDGAELAQKLRACMD